MKKDTNHRLKERKIVPNISASFRDPSGFVFIRGGVVYRQVNGAYAPAYDILMRSGLYAELARKGYLVPHKEIRDVRGNPGAYKILRPERIPFISYPYEWCFSELKDAALAMLAIERIALKYGMTLKDASAYNIQFKSGKPILIDTLSFERYREGAPWVAYRQFCEHFLAPLALMSRREIRLGQLMRIYPNGIPLDLASKLLPWKSWFAPATFFHLHLHARSQRKYGQKKVDVGSSAGFDRKAMDAILEDLGKGIASLTWQPQGTEWDEYYDNTNYSKAAAEEKFVAVERYINAVRPRMLWDIGANEGYYSRAASKRGIETIAFDIDPASVEKNYLSMKLAGEKNLLPLILDATNPSPALGWNNKERSSLIERGPADLVLALALIHHLAISNNVPFEMVAEFFSNICKALIIEFVPKDDSQVRRLLRNRGDIFDWYNQESFEEKFKRYFVTSDLYHLPTSKRIVYLMKRK